MVVNKLQEDKVEEGLSLEEQVEKELTSFQKRILESANLSDREKEKVLKNKKSFSDFINNILNWTNKKVLEKNEVLELLLEFKPEIFKTNILIKNIIYSKLEKDFWKNKNLAFLVLKNFIKSWEKLSDINFFIKNVSWENEETKNILEDKFSKLLEQFWRISKIETQKLFYNIKDQEAIQLILNSQLINEDWKINQKILKIFEKELNNNLISKENNSKKEIINFLLNKFSLNLDKFKNNSIKIFIESLANLFTINKKIDENTKSENWDENNEKEESNWESKIGDEKDEYLEKNMDFFNDYNLLDFCSSGCYLSDLWNNYWISINNNKIEISKEDYKKFNKDSLSNYINFNKILYEAGLSFLFENKYKSGFIQLLRNNILWFDYTKWKGFSEFNTLKTLNIIWNLIWIPETFYWKKWELWEFDWILSAIEFYKTINWTWIINKNKIWTPWWLVWPNIIERQFLNLGIIWENGDFSVLKSESILKNWLDTKEEDGENEYS